MLEPQNTKKIKILFVAFVMLIGFWGHAKEDEMILIKKGSYIPFFMTKKGKEKVKSSKPIDVESFEIDKDPVTQKKYLEFVKENTKWQRSHAKSIFVDSHYLENWQSDLKPPQDQENSPVVFVSWFAAKAYCEWKKKQLPTVDQWEYVADDQGRGAEAAKKKILDWYGKPNEEKLASVGQDQPNGYGVGNLHGLIWEWVLDFNSAIASEESRNSDEDNNMFCGSGSLNAVDSSDYARFMRYSLRNSLKANYTTANLGFRCAKETKK